MGAKNKEHLCKDCGESETENFYKGRKSLCKKCEIEKNYKNNQNKKEERIIKDFLCKDCGESETENFYKGRKSLCKDCEIEKYKRANSSILLDELDTLKKCMVTMNENIIKMYNEK